MIKPGKPTIMFAAHDQLLDVYAMPLSTRPEARLIRNASLAHLTPPERQRLFPVVPVSVTITPAPDPEAHIHQAHLFSEAHDAA